MQWRASGPAGEECRTAVRIVREMLPASDPLPPCTMSVGASLQADPFQSAKRSGRTLRDPLPASGRPAARLMAIL